MKPLIIIPDANQKTITLTIEDFKKTVSDVWEDGYKEGQATRKSNLSDWITTTGSSFCTYKDCGEAKESLTEASCTRNACVDSVNSTIDKLINKRTFDKGNLPKTNIW